MAKTSPDPIMLDRSAFQDRDRAIELASDRCPAGYTSIAKRHLADMANMSTGTMLFMAFTSRMRGLHEGVVREIVASNPHAALPLIRAWAEVITIGLYVSRNPQYVEFLLHGPGENRPGRKSFEAMFHAVKEDAEQLRLVYGELSEYSHFGPLAVWNVHSIEDEAERIVTWTDVPHWRDDTHFQVACAQAHELAAAGRDCLERLGGLLVSPPSDTK